MKIKTVQFLITAASSALIAYWFYLLSGEDLRVTVTIGSFLFVFSTLTPMTGIRFDDERVSTNIRVVCILFFIICNLSNLFFSLIGFSPSSYFIVNGLLFLCFWLIVVNIASTINAARGK